MKKIILGLITAIVCVWQVNAQAWEWVKSFEGNQCDINVNGVSSDQYGNSFTVGSYNNTINLGGASTYSTTSESDYDGYLAKYRPSGGFDWVKIYNGTGYCRAAAVTNDVNGNVLVVGQYNGEVKISGTIMPNPAASSHMFIAKYTNTGSFLWIKYITTNALFEYAIPVGIACDGTGNAYITGSFTSTFSFNGISITSSGDQDIFLAKFDVNGNTLWAKNAGGLAQDQARGIGASSSGTVFITGNIRTNASFGGVMYGDPANIEDQAYTACYYPNGNVKWVKTGSNPIIGDANGSMGTAVAADNLNNSYVTGVYSGRVKFGSTTLATSPYDSTDNDSYLIKYDANGNIVWIKRIGGQEFSYEICEGISWDPTLNRVYLSGYHAGTTYFNNNLVSISSNNYSYDIFVATYSANGNYLSLQHGGTPNADAAPGIKFSINGTYYLAGGYNLDPPFTTFNLYNQPLGNAGVLHVSANDALWNGFLAKFNFNKPPMRKKNNVSMESNSIQPLHTENIQMNIYPNPSTGKYRVELQATEGEITISNILGQQIHTISADENTTHYEFDISTQPSGIYFMEMKEEGQVVYRTKIIKE